MTFNILQNIQAHFAKVALLLFVVLAPLSSVNANVKDELSLELEQQITALLLEQVIQEKKEVAISSEVTSCRNTQILSYSPVSGSSQTSLSEFIFYVKNTTKISSLELSINGRDYPVQYTQNSDGSYKARVVNLDNLQGNLYISMGAQSENAFACNDLLYTSISVSPEQKATTVVETNSTGNGNAVSQSNTNSTVSGNVTVTKNGDESKVRNQLGQESNASTTTNENELALVDDKETTEVENNRSLFSWPWSWFTSAGNDVVKQEITSSTSVNVVSTEDENEIISSSSSEALAASSTDVSTSSLASIGEDAQVKAAQAALLFGLINKDKEACSTVGALWPWYVWLGIIWLWLIAVWVAISFYAEPVFGTPSYAKRLTYVMLISAIVGVGIWYFTNPCFTHAWLPATFIALSILLHWLYSEDVQ